MSDAENISPSPPCRLTMAHVGRVVADEGRATRFTYCSNMLGRYRPILRAPSQNSSFVTCEITYHLVYTVHIACRYCSINSSLRAFTHWQRVATRHAVACRGVQHAARCLIQVVVGDEMRREKNPNIYSTSWYKSSFLSKSINNVEMQLSVLLL